MSKIKIIVVLITISLSYVIYNFSEVDVTLTKNDIEVIKKLDLDNNCKNINTLDKQVKCISSMQNKVFALVEVSDNGIGHNKPREPINLVKIKKGLCYDRSRFIEKILTYYKIPYRHVSIYFTDDNSSFPYLNINSYSHAFTEVKTSKGWMVVDSIEPFIGKNNSTVYDAFELKKQISKNKNIPLNFKFGDYSVIYGLYSRHGKFYPPYNSLPDINWEQFLCYNIGFTTLGICGE